MYTTFQVSPRQPLSGNRLSLIGVCICLLGAAPVESKTDDGVVDWSARIVRVVGVGTPNIVSNTGALTNDDLYKAARVDAEKRLRRALYQLPMGNGSRLGDLPALAPLLHKTVLRLVAKETLRFADGTVHLPVEASFAWVSERVGGRGRPSRAPTAPTEPTGIILELGSVVQPSIRALLVSANGLTVSAGTGTDPVGAHGLCWVRSRAEALVHPLAGERPLVLPAAVGSSGPGQIFRLGLDASRVFEPGGVPGGLVIVMPQGKRKR